MKKFVFLIAGLLVFFNGTAQVGINTTNPAAQLEIKTPNTATPTNLDGVLIPKVDTFATGMTAAQNGMLIYLTTTVGLNTPGFYYWNHATTTWIPILSGAKTVTLDQAYDTGGAGAGRAIVADNGAVTINGNDGLVSTGTFNSGALMPTGTGIRMVWNPRKAAFRAGSGSLDYWDDAQTGSSSVAFGASTKASGIFSSAFNAGTTASGPSATAFNSNTVASGDSSVAFGFQTFAEGDFSTSFGSNTTASGRLSSVFGRHNTAASLAETVIGSGATNYTVSTNGALSFRATNLTDRLFTIGNGYDSNNNSNLEDSERSDAMVVLKNGNTGIGTSTPTAKLEVNGSLKITDGNQGAGKVLTSDANGLATWTNPSSTSGWSLTGNSGTNSGNFLGTTDSRLLSFRTNNAERARIFSDGRTTFGMGMPIDDFNALSKFEIGSDDGDNDLTIRHSGTDIPVINILKSRGIMKTPTNVATGDEVGSLRFWGYVNGSVGGFSNFAPAGRIISLVESVNANTLNAGMRLIGSSLNNGIYINSNGNVNIGTLTAPSANLQVVGSIRFNASGSAGVNKVLTSLDNLGNAEWRTAAAIASGTLDEAYDFGGAGNGRTITADTGAVTIAGNDGLVSTGILGSGALTPTGAGIKMIWNPRKAAFRAGLVSDDRWNDANVGQYSSAFGFNGLASGQAAAVFGINCIASNTYAMAMGQNNTASGIAAVALNSANQAIGGHSLAANFGNSTPGFASAAFGRNNWATGAYAAAFGYTNAAEGFAETVFGIGATNFNYTTGSDNSFNISHLSNRLFVVGNALDANNNNLVEDSERSDAFVILRNGNTGFGNSIPQERLHVNGKVRIADGSQAAGRVLVSDANGTGTWQTNSATNAWGLGGNVATNPATNFIGTTDAQPLVVRTNNTEKMRVNANGFVGMGTNDPDRELEVYGIGTQYARITSSGTSEVGIELRRSGTASDWQMRNDGGIMFFGQSNDDMATFTDVLRIGGSSVTPATDNFAQLGQLALRWTSVCAVNGVIQTSDANDKKEMLPLRYGLDKIKALRPISFQWKDEKIDNHSTHLGFVAQEVQKVLPEIVVDSDWVEGEEGTGRIWKKSDKLGMKYAEVIPVLVKAVQEQQQIIESQNRTIAEIMQRLEQLENKK